MIIVSILPLRLPPSKLAKLIEINELEFLKYAGSKAP